MSKELNTLTDLNAADPRRPASKRLLKGMACGGALMTAVGSLDAYLTSKKIERIEQALKEEYTLPTNDELNNARNTLLSLQATECHDKTAPENLAKVNNAKKLISQATTYKEIKVQKYNTAEINPVFPNQKALGFAIFGGGMTAGSLISLIGLSREEKRIKSIKDTKQSPTND